MTISEGSIPPGGLYLFVASKAAWMIAADSLDKMWRNFISNELQCCWVPSCYGRWDWESCGLVADCGGCRSSALKTESFDLQSSEKWVLFASQIEHPTTRYTLDFNLTVPQFPICTRIIPPFLARTAVKQINVCKPLGYYDNKCFESPGEN